jgi:hypothetical protein
MPKRAGVKGKHKRPAITDVEVKALEKIRVFFERRTKRKIEHLSYTYKRILIKKGPVHQKPVELYSYNGRKI